MREIMSIGAILGSPKVVVVFNSVRIFIANHVNSDWFQLLLFYKLRKVNNTNISKLISKDQLTFQRLFGSWLGVVGWNESYLWWFLDTVHVLPLGQQFVWVFQVVFCWEEVDSSFEVDYDYQRQGIDKENIANLMGNNELTLQKPFFEIPQFADIGLAEGGNNKLGRTKTASIDIFLRNIIDIPHNIFPWLYLLKMMSIIMNFNSFIPTPRNQQFVLIIVHKNRYLLLMWWVWVDEQSWKQINCYDLSFNCTNETFSFSVVKLYDWYICLYYIFVVFGHGPLDDRPYLQISSWTDVHL